MSSVRYSLDERVARIDLDDGKANALSFDLMDALMEALDRADSEARALVIAGRPGRFSAGFDLKVMMSGIDNAVKMLRRGAEVYTRLYSFPMPVIMACTGHAIAGGSLLLLTGDRRIGIRGPFQIGLNEVAISMTLPRLGVELALARLDPRRQTEAVALATLYSPDEAVEVGFLDRVVEPEALVDEALAEAAKLARLPREPIRGTKFRLREHTLARIEACMDADMAEFLAAAK